MSKRVSNKPNRTGARTYRTHLVHVARIATKARVIAERRTAQLQARANRFRDHIASLPKHHVTWLERARMFVRRVVGV